MSKVKPTTKEQLIYFLIHNLSLGTYDKRFLTNIQSLQITEHKPVTSNQAELLNKVILRYAKQLRKKEINAEEMTKLPWGLEPIESLPEYTDAFCTIKDNVVEIRSPYHKEFIKEIKETQLRLTWDKETKIWSGPLSEVTLKHFINCLDRNYQVIHYCPKTTEIINNLADFEGLEWNPTYKKINGNYFITSINKSLYEATTHITLNASLPTVAKLSSAGIKIDDSVINEVFLEHKDDPDVAKLIDMAVNDKQIYEVSDPKTLVKHIASIGCDYVLIYEMFKNSAALVEYKKLYELLTENNIKYDVLTRSSTNKYIDMTIYEYPIIVNTALWGLNSTTSKLRAAKTIHLGNNKPIDFK